MISQRITDAVAHFIEHVPPQRLSTNLRKMLLEFLSYEDNGGVSYLSDLALDLNELHMLLDILLSEAGKDEPLIHKQ